MKRILIADDHELIRRGIRSVLLSCPDIDICGEAVDGQDAIELSRQVKPDVVLMDISLPRLDGLEATREIRRILPQTQILVVSQHDSPLMMQQALQAGAHGYVVKSAIATQLVAGIEKVCGGAMFFDAAMLEGHENPDLPGIGQTGEAEALGGLNDSIARLWSIHNVERGLEIVLTAVIELLGADKGNVQIADAETGALETVSQHGFDQELLASLGEASAQDDSASGKALRRGQMMVIEDVETDASHASFRAVARQAGFRAAVSTPLIGRNAARLGMLSVYFASAHRPAAFDLGLLELYAGQAAMFIERCRSEEALRRSEERFRGLTESLKTQARARTEEKEPRHAGDLERSERVRDLSALLLEAQDNERRRIARELHDSAGQILTVLSLNLDAIAKLAANNMPQAIHNITDSQGLVQQLIRETRTMSYLLYPPMLDQTGLADALRWYVQGLRDRSPLKIELEIPSGFKRPKPALELVIFRVVQEALTNIHRHSGSKTATIRLAQDRSTVSVEVEDCGKGIAAERLMEIQSQGSGVGIRGMRERVRLVKGEMRIQSNAGGTRISMVFPVSEGSVAPEVGQLQPGERAGCLDNTA